MSALHAYFSHVGWQGWRFALRAHSSRVWRESCLALSSLIRRFVPTDFRALLGGRLVTKTHSSSIVFHVKHSTGPWLAPEVEAGVRPDETFDRPA